MPEGDTLESFVGMIASTIDVEALSSFAADASSGWAATRALTLIACYRMKQLFHSYDTRDSATRATGYSSWTDWLTSIDWPVSPSLIRTRALDIDTYRGQGASWSTVCSILANAPTAGHDATTQLTDSRGRLLAHVNEEDLPGGSFGGLLEAIAESPNPGQGRALVQQVTNTPRVYPERALLTSRALHINLTMERQDHNETYYMTLQASYSDGSSATIPLAVANWIASRLGVQLERQEA